MTKQTIAVDIDDVLAANAKAFIDYTNQKWATNLTVDDYDEHWAEVWKTDLEETRRRADEMHDLGIFGKHEHFSDAKPVLEALAKRYNLVVVTARRKTIQHETLAWLEKNFPGVFSNVHFAGIWDEITDNS
jgi:5'(3')-deoxyribonucleotidase